MSEDKRIYLIALSLLKGAGNILARHLLQYFGEAEALFTEKRQRLEKIPGIGRVTSEKIINSRTDALKRAEQELAFIEKNKIRLFSIPEEDYPLRLRECQDAPVVFYFRGHANLNAKRVLSVVGTRSATDYGRSLTATLLKDLAALCPDVLVISGLAYGIDVCAHRYALANGLPTVGVLAHGLDRIYPAVHRNMAVEMLEGGGLLTDFVSGTTPDRENFLQRNRIIAGLADATVVVESAAKGGALITADIAFSYGRDVYTFPGRVTDEHSKGCNQLVRINKAGLITSARDLILALQWDTALTSPVSTQTTLSFEDKKTDHPILALFAGKSEIHVNEMALRMNLPVHQLLPLLFDLEMDGYLKALPGGIYKPNG